MNEFKIKDAVDLLYKQTTIINSLWTVYVAATFAAGGFSALTGASRAWVAVALTIAFGAFTFGHWRMLKPELAARWTLREEIKSVLLKKPLDSECKFDKSLHFVSDIPSRPYKGLIVHASIDTCVFSAIWIRVFLAG